ncbi:MAG: bifunctional phosphoribosyl-AMP cyclohydrolase/phosphoribosyl-ATP diphosphatase HisIE [Gemmatimonadales bacterium]
MTGSLDLDRLDFGKGGGLVTVVTQDDRTGEVLMVAHADREALEQTLQRGEMVYRSRTRGLWHKGATSGNTQAVRELVADCDGDTVLARVMPAGPACHTGARSCFEAAPPTVMGRLDQVVANRAADEREPIGGEPRSYTAKLLGDRNLRLKKLGEEAGELAVACADGDGGRAVGEAADLVYHTLVALRAVGRSWADVEAALDARSAARR